MILQSQAIKKIRIIIQQSNKIMKKEQSPLPPNIIDAIAKYKDLMTGDAQTLKQYKAKYDRLIKAIQLGESEQLQHLRLESYVDKNDLKHEQILRICIKGRENTHYQYKKVRVVMLVLDGYPNVPPKFFFENVRKNNKWERFEHINVASSGEMCQNINKVEMQYTKIITLAELVEAVENILYNINATSAYDGPLFKAYDSKFANGGIEYQKALAEETKYLDWASDSSDDDSD